VINRLITCGDEDVVKEARRRFKAHLENKEVIPADLRGACYRAATMFGDEADFAGLMEIYRSTELQEEKNRAGRAFGYTKNPERLEKAIKFALSDEVRDQDKVFFIMPIGVSNPLRAWRLFQENKELLRDKYRVSHLMTRLVKFTTENLASEEMAAEVDKFFKEFKLPGSQRTVQQSIETIKLNANWLKRDTETMRQFLSK